MTKTWHSSRKRIVAFLIVAMLSALLPGVSSASTGDDSLALQSTPHTNDQNPNEVNPGDLIDWAFDYANETDAVQTNVPIVIGLSGGQQLTGPIQAPPGWAVEYSYDEGANWWGSWDSANAVKLTADSMDPTTDFGRIEYVSTDTLNQPTDTISQGSNGGDGWVPIVVGTKVFAVTHHTEVPQLSCIDMAAGGQVCPDYPKSFPHPSANTGDVAAVVGTELWFSYHDADASFGFYCWDAASDSSCGQLPVGTNSSISVAQFDSVSRPQSVGDKVYFAGGDGQMYCADATAKTLCANYPVANGNQTFAFYPADLEVINGLLFLAVSDAGPDYMSGSGNATVSCFDPATGGACAGWTGAQPVTSTGIFTRTDTAGVPNGVCSRGITMQCYDLDGANAITIADSTLYTPYIYPNVVEARVGTRIIAGDFPNSQALCFDWATGASCGPMPMPTMFYGVSQLSGTCVVGLGDPGQYATIQAMSGTTPCVPPVAAVVRHIARRQFQCAANPSSSEPMTWRALELTNVDLTSNVEFESLVVTIKDNTGHIISGPHEMIGTDGVIAMSGTDPDRLFEIIGQPVGSVAWDDSLAPVVRYIYDGPPAQVCFQTHVTTLCHLSTPNVGVAVTGSLGPTTKSASYAVTPLTSCDSSLSGTVYDDANRNGVFDPGESVVPNAVVWFYDTTRWQFRRLITDTNGFYSVAVVGGQQYYYSLDTGRVGATSVTMSPAGANRSDGYVTVPGGTDLGQQDFGLAFNADIDVTIATTALSGAPGEVINVPFTVGDLRYGSPSQLVTFTAPTGTTVAQNALPTDCSVVDLVTVQCTIGALAGWSNGSASVSIPVIIDPLATPGSVLTGSASVASTMSYAVDANMANNVTPVSIEVLPPKVDLVISTVGYVGQRGDTATLAVTVNNFGPSASTGFSVDVTVPSNVDLAANIPANCEVTAPGTLHCTFDALASGSFTSVEIPVIVHADAPLGALDGTATVQGNEADPHLRNNTAPVSVTVLAPEVDLAVSLADFGGEPGGTGTTTLTVTNNGPDASLGATVTVTPPDGIVFDVANLPAGCTAGVAPTVVCVTDPLAATGAQTFTLPFAIGADVAPGPLPDGVATLVVSDTAEIDIDPTNDVANGPAIVVPTVVDLSITALSVSGPRGSVQTTVIAVTNNGPSAAYGESVSFTAPTGTTLVVESLPTNCVAISATEATCTLSSLAVGDTAAIDIALLIDADAPAGTLAPVSVSVSTTSPFNTDVDSANDIAHLDASVIVQFDLSATGSSLTLDQGGTGLYSLVIANNGPNAAPDVQVDIVVPQGLEVVAGALPSGCVLVDAATVRCDLATIDASSAVGLTIPVQALAGTVAGELPAGQVSVQSTAMADHDLNPANNTQALTATVLAPPTVVIGTPDLAVSLRLPETIDPNTGFVGTVTVTNVGDANSGEVTLRIVLTDGVSVDPNRLDELAAAGCAVVETNVIECHRRALDPADSDSFSIPLIVTSADGQVSPLVASVYGVRLELNRTNNTTTAVLVLTNALFATATGTVPELAFTGRHSAPLVEAGFVMLAAGVALAQWARRVRQAAANRLVR